MNEQNSQTIVALAIVSAMALLGGALIVAAVVMKDAGLVAAGGVGTIIGALATGLNAPSGVSAALRSALQPPPPPPSPDPPA